VILPIDIGQSCFNLSGAIRVLHGNHNPSSPLCLRTMMRTGSIFMSLKGIRAYLNFDEIGPDTQLRWRLFSPLLESGADWGCGACTDLLDADAKIMLKNLNCKGFLHIHDCQGKEMYCFHSPLHMLYYQDQLLTSTVQRIDADASSLQSFLLACIPRLSKRDLNTTLSVGVDGRILERKLQFAFCVAATSVLPKHCKVCPDVGKVSRCRKGEHGVD